MCSRLDYSIKCNINIIISDNMNKFVINAICLKWKQKFKGATHHSNSRVMFLAIKVMQLVHIANLAMLNLTYHSKSAVKCEVKIVNLRFDSFLFFNSCLANC